MGADKGDKEDQITFRLIVWKHHGDWKTILRLTTQYNQLRGFIYCGFLFIVQKTNHDLENRIEYWVLIHSFTLPFFQVQLAEYIR